MNIVGITDVFLYETEHMINHLHINHAPNVQSQNQ